MSYENLIGDADQSVGRYIYGHLHDLTREELYLCVFVEVACRHFGTTDVMAIFAIIVGLPIVPTRAKPGGAIPNTSIASVICRELINVRLQRRSLPTLVGYFNIRVRSVNHLGAFTGRWLPWLGKAILVYDLIVIDWKTLVRFNQLVKPEDRILDGTPGTLG
jgi:hypothetical protein